METPLWSGRLLCPEKDRLSTDNIQTLYLNGNSARNTCTSDTLLETLTSSVHNSTSQPIRPSVSCGGCRVRGPHWAVTATLGAGAGGPRGMGTWGAAFWLLSADKRSRRSV